MTTNPDDSKNAENHGLDPALVAHGFNLVGVLAAEHYDGLVGSGWHCAEALPSARSAMLLGCGGVDFFRAVRSSPEWEAGIDPVDRFARRWLEFQCAQWREAGFESRGFLYTDQRGSGNEAGARSRAQSGAQSKDGGRHADFVSLGAASGMGVPSRLGILLHPRFGPWFSIRGLLLTERPLAPTPPLAWNPCRGCPAPCATACPSDRAVGAGGFDIEACFSCKVDTPSCQSSCAARRTCVYGRDEAYDSEAETYYTQSAFRVGREFRRQTLRVDPDTR